jgi:hypothetical protein
MNCNWQFPGPNHNKYISRLQRVPGYQTRIQENNLLITISKQAYQLAVSNRILIYRTMIFYSISDQLCHISYHIFYHNNEWQIDNFSVLITINISPVSNGPRDIKQRFRIINYWLLYHSRFINQPFQIGYRYIEQWLFIK